jgi:hypothetical protein
MQMWRCLGYGLLLQLLVIGPGLAEAGAVSPRSGTMPVRHTLKELRDQYVVKQQLDYSCGAAALATLMTYYFGDETSEQEVLKLLLARLTQHEQTLREKRGFSLLDLKHAAQAKGYRAAGFKLRLEQLRRIAAPVIVFIQPRGYQHFAVLRGIDRGRVFLADPARGNIRMSVERFLQEWSGIVFALGKAGEENITTYPLALPRPDYVQPELLRVGHRSALEALPIDLAVQSQRR